MSFAKGDLVQVVRDCCAVHLGLIFVFMGDEGRHPWMCRACRARGEELVTLNTEAPAALGVVFPISWLKKIPPLEELEGAKTESEEELHA